MDLEQIYENETGEEATWRYDREDLYTVEYVKWLEERVKTPDTKRLLPCPFCGNVPVERKGKFIVSHEETCFLRRFERHTQFKDFDKKIWNRRER